MALDKEKAQNVAGKVVDKLNEVGDKTTRKATKFAQDKGLDKKAAAAKEKTEDFIKEHKIDVAAEKTAGAVGAGLRKLGEGLGKAGTNLEKKMNNRQEARKQAEADTDDQIVTESEENDA